MISVPAIARPRHIGLIPLDDWVREACDFLCQHEPEGGYYLGFSGGKDSIVAERVARLAGVTFHAGYSVTRIDPPEVVRFIRAHYPNVEWRWPTMTMWEGIKKKSPPLRMQRWCCDVLKKNPAKDTPYAARILGIRSEESFRRRQRPRFDPAGSMGQVEVKPVFHFKEWQVWEFIDRYRLSYPNLYDEGFDRLGCVVCPFLYAHGNLKPMEKHKARWPGIYKTFEHVTREWFEERMKEGLRPNQKHATFEEYIMAYYGGFETPGGKKKDEWLALHGLSLLDLDKNENKEAA